MDRQRAVNRTRAIALRSAVAVVGLYLAAVVAACTFQRQMLYFPDPREVAPDLPMVAVHLTTADHERLVGWWLAPKPGEPVILHFGGNGDSLAGEAERWRIIGD